MAETLEEFVQRIEAIAASRGRGSLRERIRGQLAVDGLWIEGEAKKNATRRPRARTGYLRNSIRTDVTDDARGLSLALRAGNRATVKYARAQEEGAVITPKRGRYLAIPLDSARTAAGVARWPSPRAVPGLFALEVRGKVFLVRQQGPTLDFLYVLKERVRIPPTWFLHRAMKRGEKRVTKNLVALTVKAIEGGGDVGR